MERPKLRLPIGQSDFRVLREQGFAYVDKSSFIVEVIEARLKEEEDEVLKQLHTIDERINHWRSTSSS